MIQQSYGFRLASFEVLNWGTFDQQIWQITPDQCNSLLTGNIGSGKSTLVDGLTTLLVPTRKLAFNKAAGAADKERSLESYYHGYYTSVQDDTGKGRPIGLRKRGHCSVLLAQFRSEALGESISLAQVFWLKPGESRVRRLFVVAQSQLEIKQHFANFGSQINQLRKQLKQIPGLQLFDRFAPYAKVFSKLMGLSPDGKALELFNQTISMKSVGSVTDFVRQNMLEKPDIEQQLQELERNYDDLKRLHDAVVAARRKVELLQPIKEYGEGAQAQILTKERMVCSRSVLDNYVAGFGVDLYQKRIDSRSRELDKLTISLDALDRRRQGMEQSINQIKDQIQQNGGGRLQQIESEIERLSGDRQDSQRLCHNYLELVNQLEMDTTLSAESYIANIDQAKERVEQLQPEFEQLEQRVFESRQNQQSLEQQLASQREQIKALQGRKSNISLKQLKIREQLCDQLGLDESRLPFVGELLQVKPEAELWQGAIERVMHNFGLSMLVPDELYGDISELVEQSHLGARLVYYRVQQSERKPMPVPEEDSLLSKVELKPDSEYYDWLRSELQRFDYRCCNDLADFRRSTRAITPQGQIKTSRFRHEKDDRHNLLDRSRYVLGWSNRDKIELLKHQCAELDDAIAQAAKVCQACQNQRSVLDEQSRHARNLANLNLAFHQINWPAISQSITVLEQERDQLEQSSDRLQQLRSQLKEAEEQRQPCEQQWRELIHQQGAKQTELELDRETLVQKQALHSDVAAGQQQELFPILKEFHLKHFAERQLQIRSLDKFGQELREKLNIRIQNLESAIRQKLEQMLEAMGRFAHAFPAEVEELDQSMAALPEYQQLLQQLVDEDLPRHEARFKEMLNRDTIRAMTLFLSYLERQEEAIDARLHQINSALSGLDYQEGTYIQIDRISSMDLDIRDFRQRLKACVEHSTDDSLYSEEKFLRVKDLIEQLRNEPKWTQKVIDVRYWSLFNVIERYREDQSEKECYSDSGGKSGGQKEKLAYSILAAAILLQYGLVEPQHGNRQKRRFNLVVIDEAFGRGSKDSTRFGLELFKQLGLQLLLVTPMQKLDVIEHYVQHVHFVDQRNNRSQVLNMTIEDYRLRQAQHKQLAQVRQLIRDDSLQAGQQ